jgi:putative transposase
MTIFGESSLNRAIREYVEHYNFERPHQGIGNVVIECAEDSQLVSANEVRAHERLGGLLKRYKAAA